MRKLNGDHCHCRACGEYFNSTYAFDMHRVGAYSGKYPTRRCLTVGEMLDAGMGKSATDWWVSHLHTDSSLHARQTAGDHAEP